MEIKAAITKKTEGDLVPFFQKYNSLDIFHMDGGDFWTNVCEADNPKNYLQTSKISPNSPSTTDHSSTLLKYQTYWEKVLNEIRMDVMRGEKNLEH